MAATNKEKKAKAAKADKATKTAKPKSKETVASLRKRIAELEEQVTASTSTYGTLLETHTNNRIKLDVALGQILKALYVLGIGPDEIMKKCDQMFRKKVVAD